VQKFRKFADVEKKTLLQQKEAYETQKKNEKDLRISELKRFSDTLKVVSVK
jgi:hypothetical protein